MLLKSSGLLLFVSTCCFISADLASLYPRQSNGDGLLPEDVNESVKRTQLTNETKKFVIENKRLSDNVEMISRTSIEKGNLSAASWALDYWLRGTLFVLANAVYTNISVIGINPDIVPDEDKTVALAVSKLLMSLKTMERTDQVLKNVSLHIVTVVAGHITPIKKGVSRNISYDIPSCFQILNDSMEADEELRHVYKQRKSEAEDTLRQDHKMIAPFLNVTKTMLQGLANKLFMKQSVKHFSMIFSTSDHQRYLLARALIQMAHSSRSESKINEIYQQALVRAAEAELNESHVEINETLLNTIKGVLFNTIEKALESEPTLNTEVQTIMKQIEGNTIYDADMFNIDFSLL